MRYFNSVFIKFNIFEGKRELVERINIIGNNVTNESVVRGELILDEGDPYTKLNLEKSISKIKARRIFKNVSYEVKNGSEDNSNAGQVVQQRSQFDSQLN